MAMTQWCSAMARRMMSTYRMPMSTPFTSSSLSPYMVPAAVSSSSSSTSTVPSASELIVCGRGDKRTKRGKRFKGTFGNARPKKKQMIQRIKDKVEVPRSTPWPLPFKLI